MQLKYIRRVSNLFDIIVFNYPLSYQQMSDNTSIQRNCHTPGALSSASPGVPGNCRKQCSIPGKLPGDTIIAPVPWDSLGILTAHA